MPQRFWVLTKANGRAKNLRRAKWQANVTIYGDLKKAEV